METLTTTELKDKVRLRNSINANEFKLYIYDSIDLEGYTNTDKTFQNLYNTFKSEYFTPQKEKNIKAQLIEWLTGLPSSINLPFYYYDIRLVLKTFGVDKVDQYDDQTISTVYYDLIASIILQENN